MNEIALISVGEASWVAIDWSSAMPEGSTLGTVLHTTDLPMTVLDQATDQNGKRSLVKLTCERPGVFLVKGESTLTPTENAVRRVEIVVVD